MRFYTLNRAYYLSNYFYAVCDLFLIIARSSSSERAESFFEELLFAFALFFFILDHRKSLDGFVFGFVGNMGIVPCHGTAAMPHNGSNDIQRDSNIGTKGDKSMAEAVQAVSVGTDLMMKSFLADSRLKAGGIFDDLNHIMLDPRVVVLVPSGHLRQDVVLIDLVFLPPGFCLP